MASVSLPSRHCRAFSNLGELNHKLPASSCRASGAAAASYGWAPRVCATRPRQGDGERFRLRLEGGLGARVCGLSFSSQFDSSGVWGNFERLGYSASARQRLEGVICLMPGVGGGFWEGADSESKSNNQFVPRKGTTRKEPSVLLNLIQEIEPLDISLISKDTSSDSTDAMKRTISGMLGLLPSDQFHVAVEVSREPLARLLVSSMMTGYTLRNAEYRLCLQRNLELTEEDLEEIARDGGSFCQKAHVDEGGNIMESAFGAGEKWSCCDASSSSLGEPAGKEAASNDTTIPRVLGQLTPEAESYIRYLQTKLSLVSKELEDSKLGHAALQMQNFVGEEKNDLLDYLRSLEPDKVAELSQPTSSEVEDVIQQVISRLLEELCPKLQSKSSQFGNGTSSINSAWDQEGGTELVGNPPMQFQSLVTVTRDYLARLLFWCMLLGHHMRGLEYRLELSRTLSLSGDIELGTTEA